LKGGLTAALPQQGPALGPAPSLSALSACCCPTDASLSSGQPSSRLCAPPSLTPCIVLPASDSYDEVLAAWRLPPRIRPAALAFGTLADGFSPLEPASAAATLPAAPLRALGSGSVVVPAPAAPSNRLGPVPAAARPPPAPSGQAAEEGGKAPEGEPRQQGGAVRVRPPQQAQQAQQPRRSGEHAAASRGSRSGGGDGSASGGAAAIQLCMCSVVMKAVQAHHAGGTLRCSTESGEAASWGLGGEGGGSARQPLGLVYPPLKQHCGCAAPCPDSCIKHALNKMKTCLLTTRPSAAPCRSREAGRRCEPGQGAVRPAAARRGDREALLGIWRQRGCLQGCSAPCRQPLASLCTARGGCICMQLRGRACGSLISS
jgi:hypothetical protein